MRKPDVYLMEGKEETLRLEVKTIPDDVRSQALWCGIRPGLRVLDVGCGPGKTTSILHEMIQPEGAIVGVDCSGERIAHARERYGNKPGIDFCVHDLRDPLNDFGKFDFIWVRFVLEYHLAESFDIVGHLKNALKPGGVLCLLDLDYNCLSHYELPPRIAELLPRLMHRLQEKHNFDVYAGRKLYAYLYDHGFGDIQVNMTAHHLIYGNSKDVDAFNWMKKIEVNASRFDDLFNDYPGGHEAFIADFRKFFLDPRRFTYTPLILCKGRNV
ncbi:MAG: methyltransferase type 11 [Syntrophus sp. (in: bacteria)]|nr:methyltransferase type 11 [Syntrophus sp. (in: bacteria)]